MIHPGSRFTLRPLLLFISQTSQPIIVKRPTSWTTSPRKTTATFQRKMGASWSASWSKEKPASITWTSIDSPPTTNFYDDFEVSVGLSEDATARLTAGGTWRVDFEIDIAHLQKRLQLSVQPADESSEQRLTVKGDSFRKLVENSQLSNDELCNICAMHFKLETPRQELGEFCLIADIFRGGMHEIPTDELLRKVYGTTKQTVPDRLT